MLPWKSDAGGLNSQLLIATFEEVGEHFGFLAAFASLDIPASSALTQKLLGWHPVQPGLIPDLFNMFVASLAGCYGGYGSS